MATWWRSITVAAASIAAAGGMIYVIQSSGDGSQVVVAQTLTSQDVFRGVLFGQGVVAQQLGNQPSLRDLYRANFAASNAPDQLAAVDQLMKRVSAADPNYLARFTGAVRSGNPFVVSESLREAGAALQKMGLPVDTLPETKAINFNFHFNQNLAVNQNIAINENLAINLNYYRGRQLSSKDSFQREVEVGQIAATLEH